MNFLFSEKHSFQRLNCFGTKTVVFTLNKTVTILMN